MIDNLLVLIHRFNNNIGAYFDNFFFGRIFINDLFNYSRLLGCFNNCYLIHIHHTSIKYVFIHVKYWISGGNLLIYEPDLPDFLIGVIGMPNQVNLFIFSNILIQSINLFVQLFLLALKFFLRIYSPYFPGLQPVLALLNLCFLIIIILLLQTCELLHQFFLLPIDHLFY